VLGRNTIVDTDLYSTCCAIENLWLAARVEGIGVGWVSILRHDELRTLLGIPDHIVVVAYLCLGYAQEFFDAPELQRRRWASRVPLVSWYIESAGAKRLLEAIDHQLRNQEAGAHRHDDVDRRHPRSNQLASPVRHRRPRVRQQPHRRTRH
jgi:hypothetical protein